ncbi:hypothetical protein ABFS83_02G066500 [Erythranthe nasuta]
MTGVISLRIMVLLMVIMSSLALIANAKVYYVGGKQGWNQNPQLWLGDRTFKAGDILVFIYRKGEHNVAVYYDEFYYEDCAAPDNATTYTSGHDRVKLRKGYNYIISSVPGDCDDYFLAISPYAK